MTSRPLGASLLALALLLGAAAPAGAQKPAARDPWWRHALVYEIYPRSFGDSNGDGVGDLNGVTRHLDYLQSLGVDAIWLAPEFPSPQVDFGYDISDYRAVDPQYGTLADLDRLQAEAKTRHIRVVLDFVLNHTSDKHAWFAQSAASRTNAKADWYVWSDGAPADKPGLTPFQRANVHDGRAPPNNWTSLFGGSAWEWVPARRQFYYHKFYRQQPDLNWRNPAVEHAMFDVMRFWLDRGIAGFRLDAVPTLFEDPGLHDEPETGGVDAYGAPNLQHTLTDNQPGIHDVIRRMRKVVDGYGGDRVLIGETYLPSTAELDKWYGGAAKDELQLPMDLLVGFGEHARYSADYFRPALKAAQTDLHGSQPLFVFDNHDNVRSMDRFADGVHDRDIAKGLAAILLGSRAAALTYYGAPLGMRTATPTRREDVKDPIGIAGWPREKGRDGERTPMQWTPGAQAGFSTNPRTWLPVNPDHATVNVETETRDPASLLNWHRRLAALRRSEPALRDGDMTLLEDTGADVLAWVRTPPGGAPRVLVAINTGAQPRSVRLAPLTPRGRVSTLAASDGAAVHAAGATLDLAPFATRIVRLD